MTVVDLGSCRSSQGGILDWLADLDPADQRDALGSLGAEGKARAEKMIVNATPHAAFDALGYQPTSKQWMLHDMPAWSDGGPWSVLYGGAAGGGKSRALLMDAMAWAQRIPGLELWMFRETYPQLWDSLIKELHAVNNGKAFGCRWNQGDHTLYFPHGSTLKFRHARTMNDAAELLSAACQGIYVDERTTMDPPVLEKLETRIRSGTGLPIIGVRSGSNPGDKGHMDVKTRFVDPAPLGSRRIKVATRRGIRMDRYFIKARLVDNPYLDADYGDRLSAFGPDLERAYREGDWDIFEGAAFGEFRVDIHTFPPDRYPVAPGYPLGVGIDYGIANPFAALWGMRLADGLIVVYRELYHRDLTPVEQATLIRTSSQEWELAPRVTRYWLDPSCWARQPDSPKPVGGNPPDKSIAADYRKTGVRVERAYNDRVGGWRLVHAGLRVQKDQTPRLLISTECRNLLRTLPSLPRDKKNPEDINTNTDDHAADSLRYLLGGLTGRAPRPARGFGAEQRDIRATSVG